MNRYSNRFMCTETREEGSIGVTCPESSRIRWEDTLHMGRSVVCNFIYSNLRYLSNLKSDNRACCGLVGKLLLPENAFRVKNPRYLPRMFIPDVYCARSLFLLSPDSISAGG